MSKSFQRKSMDKWAEEKIKIGREMTVAPRTKLYVPKEDFPTLLNYVDVQRQTKTRIEVTHEATIDDYWRQVTV